MPQNTRSTHTEAGVTSVSRRRRCPRWVFVASVVLALVAVVVLGFNLTPRARLRRSIRANNAATYGRVRGFARRTHIATDDSMHDYSLFVPYDLGANIRNPLLVILRDSSSEDENAESLFQMGTAAPIRQRSEGLPFIVVWAECPSGETWENGEAGTKAALELVAKIQDEYHTDPNRIYASGISANGNGAWALAADHPETFSAIVPISATRIPDSIIRKVAAAGISVWSFHVNNVDSTTVSVNQHAERRMYELGRSPRFTAIHDNRVDNSAPSDDAWNYAFRNIALHKWLSEQVCRWEPKNVPRFRLPRFRVHDFPTDRTNAPSAESNAKTAVRHHTMTHTDDGELGVSTGLKMGSDGQCHIEFRLDAGVRRCGLAFLPPGQGLNSGYSVEVANGSLYGSGGFFNGARGDQATSGAPEAGHALRVGEWNSLRVQWVGGRI